MIATLAQQVHPFDARGIAKRFRHAAIFGALDALQPGETMRFVNDHDPLSLLAQLLQRYGDALDIQYRQREPGAIVIDFVVHRRQRRRSGELRLLRQLRLTQESCARPQGEQGRRLLLPVLECASRAR
jgi:uncharacterized protein (DUF2249 family)